MPVVGTDGLSPNWHMTNPAHAGIPTLAEIEASTALLSQHMSDVLANHHKVLVKVGTLTVTEECTGIQWPWSTGAVRLVPVEPGVYPVWAVLLSSCGLDAMALYATVAGKPGVEEVIMHLPTTGNTESLTAGLKLHSSIVQTKDAWGWHLTWDDSALLEYGVGNPGPHASVVVLKGGAS